MPAWSPTRLPKIRDQICRILNDPTRSIRKTPSGPELAHLGRGLGAADLYWVSPDMAALAVGNAPRLDHVRWTTTDRPAAFGLMVFDGGIGTIEHDGNELPVDAVTWGPHPDGIVFTFFVRRARAEQNIARNWPGATLDLDQVPPLIPYLGCAQPVTTEPYPIADIPDYARTILTTLATSWALMRQPRVADVQRIQADKPTRAAYTRADRPEPETRLITLRRAYQPTEGPQLDPDRPGRHYRHRWYVPAFPRWQRKGPGLSQVELVIVQGHLRGPEGAPLLTAERVNVWRR